MNHNTHKSVKKPTRIGLGQTLSRVAEVLAQAPLTQHCAESTRAEMLRAGRVERLVNRAPLHRAGDAVGDLVLVVDGSLEISRVSAEGKRHVISFLAPGQIFGLVALLDGKAGIHDSWAHGDLTVLRIPKAVVMQSLAADPVFLKAVLGLLCERSRAVYGELMDHALLSLRTRTARAIHTLAITYGIHRGTRVVINLKISQDELADMLGVTRQSTNRELKALEREGLIKLGNSEIELLDAAGLRRVSEGQD